MAVDCIGPLPAEKTGHGYNVYVKDLHTRYTEMMKLKEVTTAAV